MSSDHHLPVEPTLSVAIRTVDPKEMSFLSNDWPIVHEGSYEDPCAVELFDDSNSGISADWRFYSKEEKIDPHFFFNNWLETKQPLDEIGFAAWDHWSGIEYSLRDIRVVHLQEIPGYEIPVILMHGHDYFGNSLNKTGSGTWVCLRPLTFEFSARFAGFDVDLPQEAFDELQAALEFELIENDWNYPDSTDEITFGASPPSLRVRVGKEDSNQIVSLIFSSGVSHWFRSGGAWKRLGVIIDTDPMWHRFVRPENARDLLEVFDGGHRKVSTIEAFLYEKGTSKQPLD